ncbi:uncharacterized protein LOC131290676 [Anopheles ziemanni]|uniref:uncharacterized protein LOC131268938 n=1 Tax=Anopheles coustani TaxID=139045 RepID=UPI002659E0AB|nr:uncharacterized protein LOC131268938 [Anopheles coustani]XP_058175822.1 uncharacterized protein LOC131290676 [Anopheles ziemanni]
MSRRGAVWCVVFLAIWLSVGGGDAKPIDVAAGNPLAEDSLDPVQSKDAIGEDVYRAKRKFRPEEWAAANAILDLLAQLKSARQGQLTTQAPRRTTTTTTTSTTTTTTTVRPMAQVKARADRSPREDDDVPQFNPDGTIMLQLPGKLFGNATNFVLAAAKLFGDFITNTAIRTARFMQLFQPIAGRHLYIQIPTPSPPGGDS